MAFFMSPQRMEGELRNQIVLIDVAACIRAVARVLLVLLSAPATFLLVRWLTA
jgi:hypothetical protein